MTNRMTGSFALRGFFRQLRGNPHDVRLLFAARPSVEPRALGDGRGKPLVKRALALAAGPLASAGRGKSRSGASIRPARVARRIFRFRSRVAEVATSGASSFSIGGTVGLRFHCAGTWGG